MAWQRTLIIAGALALAACGGGGGSTPAPVADNPPAPDPAPAPSGTAIIGLTDAPGDFLSYQVDVTALAFERAGGTPVNVLPESSTVDFAQYVETTELVTAASLPAGAYRSVTMSLDYSNAQILVEDDNGSAVAATVVDAAGAPITTAEVTVTFDDAHRFVIAAGVPAHVTLDFDLEASHKVDLSDSPPTAAFDGVFLADTLLEHPKTRRARGLLQSVDVPSATFDMKIRPFFQPRGDFGTVTLNTSDTTQYEIDQMPFTGADGLSALAVLPVDTAVLALAVFDTDAGTLVVEEVLAGSSVPWSEADIARGTVVARSGDTLTLRGASLVRTDMSVTFNDTLVVTLGPDTLVRQVGGDLQNIGVADLSVGQAVTVHGDMIDAETLAADAGLVRVRYATLAGTVRQVAPLDVDLSSINARRVGLYDFAGTGVDGANDADPDAYTVDTGALPLDGLAPGAAVQLLGLVRPFGTAPEDFVARSIADVSATAAQIRVRWLDGSGALLSADGSAITVALSEDALSDVRYVRRGGVFEDLLARGDTLTLTPSERGRGLFSLRVDRAQTVYADFATFASALAAALDGTRDIERIRSTATEVDATTFAAQEMLVVLD